MKFPRMQVHKLLTKNERHLTVKFQNTKDNEILKSLKN